MFFREKKTPSGTALQLIEAYRDDEGRPRQRVVASLGAAPIEAAERARIAAAVEKRLRGGEELFEWDYAPATRQWIDRIVRQIDARGRWRPLAEGSPGEPGAERLDGVAVEDIEHEQATALGPSLAAWQAWRDLKLDACLADLGFNEAQRQAAAATVLNRLVEPVSENALVSWLPGSSLPELLGETLLSAKRDRFYRAGDLLFARRRPIEAHLRQRQRALHAPARTLFLYDLTNTYFEGTAADNPKARRGKSKHKRHDCPQVVVGMVFDDQGFPLAHETFPGNRTDPPTLPAMLATLQGLVEEEADLFAQAKPTVVVDGGLATEANLALLRREGFGYFVNESRKARGDYAERFDEEEGFAPLPRRPEQSEVLVKAIDDPNAEAGSEPDQLVLCKSAGRREKELAIRSNAERRLREDLEKLRRRIAAGHLKDPQKIQTKIGRLQERHCRVARFYEISFQFDPAPQEPPDGVPSLVWREKEDRCEKEERLLGCYVLRTNRHGLDAETIWRTYITLTQAEEGFRTLKSHLGLRPVRHHLEWRTDAHVFVTVVAYHLLAHIRHKLERAGDRRDWTTIKRILRTHAYATILVPSENRGLLRLRKAGRPDHAQRAIYRALGVNWRHLPATKEYVPTKP